jgi:hypothetical protein
VNGYICDFFSQKITNPLRTFIRKHVPSNVSFPRKWESRRLKKGNGFLLSQE